ncbi:MAG: ABC transporter permease [Bacteroides sp.]|nr:ABC transporter permease [Bacteroides sp.]
MKQIYYALQNIIRGRSSTFIKVASLSLGLFISIILFARVAFELNYDTWYKDSEQIYMTYKSYNDEDGKNISDNGRYEMITTVEILMKHLSEYVECGFSMQDDHDPTPIKHGPDIYKSTPIAVDSLFFQTMGISLIKGDIKDMAMPDALFLSESKAKEIFQGEDPLGKSVLYGPTYSTELIVKGIFPDFPENVSIKTDAIISIHHPHRANSRAIALKTDWRSGFNWNNYVRLKKGVDVEHINKRINAVIANYFPLKEFYEYMNIKDMKISLIPLKGYFLKNSNVKSMLYILSLLGIVLLLTASFNYALISISSLPQRAKAIGVHKCSGAGTGSIFTMFFWETLFIVLIAVIVAGLLIFNFREIIEEMTEISFNNLFSTKNLWAPCIAIGILFVIGCALPGRMFSTIPVTQVFRCYTEGKKNWKHLLLFVQFLCTAFLLTFVAIIFNQYQHVTQKEMGYNYERVVHLNGKYDHSLNALSNYRNLPYVEAAEISKKSLWEYYPALMTSKNEESIGIKTNYGNADYCRFMGLKLKEGTYHTKSGEAIVNEELIRNMGGGVGQEVQGVGLIRGIITDDYIFPNVGKPESFAMYFWNNESNGLPIDIHIRLKEPFEENLTRLNEDSKKLYPQLKGEFKSYEQELKTLFQSARIFRDSVLIACIMIIIITLTGIIGYTNDEVRRRSKEIAIRKINGAEVSNILQLLCRSILYTALPATLVGLILAKNIGDLWIETTFKDILEINPLLYLGTGLCTLLIILATVIWKAWRVANENPVVSIKNE